MSILIFIIVLAVLIFVHELGHFIFAKKTGMLVEEFSIGFPPRIFSTQKGETRYSIGLIPLGGYCQILGENYDEENEEDVSNTLGTPKDKKSENDKRKFTSQTKTKQALVLVAGVFSNFVLAWFLFTISFMSGMVISAEGFDEALVEDPRLILTNVLPNSPASEAGLKAGDVLLYLKSGQENIQDFKELDDVSSFIAQSSEEIEILYKRGENNFLTTVNPEVGFFEEGQQAVGISFDIAGLVKLGFWSSLWEALKMTILMIEAVFVGIIMFFVGFFEGTSSLAQISGPVGIMALTGSAFDLGLAYLLSFVAIISINLGVINLLPFPALDGGRLLFLGIEAIKRSPIKPKIANALNLIGFILLISLMVAITFSDVSKLF